MSGRNQHHVWQALQRGFGEEKKKQTQVWVFKKNEEPFLTSTRNHGAERDFFSEGSDTSADDAITEFESRAYSLLSALRDGTADLDDSKDDILDLIAHLEIRTRFLRSEMSFFVDRMTKELESWFRNPARISELMKAYLKQNPEMLTDEIKKLGLSTADRNMVNNYLDVFLEGFIDKQAYSNSTDLFPAFEPMLSALTKTAKSGHLKALRKDQSSLSRTKLYRDLSYSVVNTVTEIILPDTMVCFAADSGISPFCQPKDGVSEVIVPLSSTQYLHGYRGSRLARTERQINRMLAGCAFESFIALKKLPEFLALRRRIGKHAFLLRKSELEAIFRDFGLEGG